MGQIIYEHPDWENSVYWEFDPAAGWESYQQELDTIAQYAAEVAHPFILVFKPDGDIPKGNPTTHMQRLVKMSKNDPKILKTIIIMESSWIIAKAFVRVISSMMSLEPEVKLAFSMEEARKVHSEALVLK